MSCRPRRARPGQGSGRDEDGFGQGGLPRPRVADEGHVAHFVGGPRCRRRAGVLRHQPGRSAARGFSTDDGGGALREEEAFVAVLPPHAVRRPAVGFVTADHLTRALRLPLVCGTNDDLVPDVGFHDDLQALRGLWCGSQPARRDEGRSRPPGRGVHGASPGPPVVVECAPARPSPGGPIDGAVRADRRREHLVRRRRHRRSPGPAARRARGRSMVRPEPRAAGRAVPRLHTRAAGARAHRRRRRPDHLPGHGRRHDRLPRRRPRRAGRSGRPQRRRLRRDAGGHRSGRTW